MPVLHSHPLLSHMRASAAELLACMFIDLFPQALLVRGGVTDLGFYYDFICDQPIDDHVLELIETRMRLQIREDQEIRSLSMMRENASDFLLHKGHPILAEQALEEPCNIISIFQLNS